MKLFIGLVFIKIEIIYQYVIIFLSWTRFLASLLHATVPPYHPRTLVNIILIRHGKPDLGTLQKLTSSEMTHCMFRMTAVTSARVHA